MNVTQLVAAVAAFAGVLAGTLSAPRAYCNDFEPGKYAERGFSIAEFRDGKKAAVSFTFDDGAADQFTLAVPELEKRGWRGTFWVIPGSLNDCDTLHPICWKHLEELASRGHEISNHGWSHVRLTELSSEAAKAEIERADSAIAAHLGKKPRTFCYPFNDMNDAVIAMASEGRVGTRTEQLALGGRNNAATMAEKLRGTLERGGWMVTMTHGILEGYDHFSCLEDFTGFLDSVKAVESDLWVAPFEEVASYSALRDATAMSIEHKDGNNFEITLSCSLDSNIFKGPLTLKIDGVTMWLRVSQDGKKLTPKGGYGHWTVDVDPFGGPVSVIAPKYFCPPELGFEPSFTVKLYPEGQESVGSNGIDRAEYMRENGDLYYVGDDARFDVYLPEEPNGQMVIITPGGGYAYSATLNEGKYLAKMLVDRGIAAVVLHYRMPNGHFDVPLADVQNTFRWCRAHAAEWGVWQIGVLGGSAGGHLAASASTMFTDEATRPDFSILYYPVITMDDRYTNAWTKKNLLGERRDDSELCAKWSLENAVTAQTPRTFIVQCEDDTAVPMENALRYYAALRANKVQAEIHIYPHGGHGWGCNRGEYIGYGRDPFEYARPEFEASLFRWLAEIAKDMKPRVQDGRDCWLFSYFADQADGLHLAWSVDGYKWRALAGGKSLLRPELGPDKLMRDPSICQGPDGVFHMVWTTGWHDRIIGHASSRDLIEWSAQQVIPVMEHEPEAKNCWAPEIFYDEPSGYYYIFWATTIPGRHAEVAESEGEKGMNHRIYYTRTRDFKKFSKTAMYFNPDFSAIDAAVVRDPSNGELIMTVKNENPNPPQKNIRLSRSRSMKKGFPVQVSEPIHGNFWAEGPSPLFIGADTLIVYYDRYMEGRYGASVSCDHGKSWQEVPDSELRFPEGIRHGTAFKVSSDVLNKLFELK